MTNKTILVTGGAGYIGSHFCKIASSKGYIPIVYDNLSTGIKNFIKWGELVIGDLDDYDLLCKILKKYKPIAVFHFAASIDVEESIINPYLYYHNNVCNTINLLKAMIDCHIKNIIFSSTAAIFGGSNNKIFIENSEKNPISPYGKSKLICETILEDFKKTYDINYTALRYFNVSGADPECELGETFKSVKHLISIVLEKYKLNEEVKIFGNNWNTKDGTCIRDYIHVCDLANAHILALEKMLNTNQSIKINLGSGTGYSVLEIIKSAENVVKNKIKYKFVDRRDGDAECVICDNTLAKKYLGWKIEYSNIEQHILHSWNWMKKTI